MEGDPIRADLIRELRVLRRLPGSFGIERITADMDNLIELVGRGSLEQAYTSLLDALAQHGRDPEGDVRAFFETAGYDTPGDNLDERLKMYAYDRHVDQRTALRRSDRGAQRLAELLRDRMVHERPWANVIGVQNGDSVLLDISVEIPESSLWRRPWVYINDTEQQCRTWELSQSDTHPMLLTAKEQFRDLEFNLAVDEDEPLLRVKVIWITQIWPSWQLGVHLLDQRIYPRFVANRDYSAEFTIWWANDDAAATCDVPLRERTDWKFNEYRSND